MQSIFGGLWIPPISSLCTSVLTCCNSFLIFCFSPEERVKDAGSKFTLRDSWKLVQSGISAGDGRAVPLPPLCLFLKGSRR